MYATLRVSALIAIGSLSLAGCAGSDLFGSNSSGSDVTTSSLTGQQQAQKVDPACGNLALEIDSLRREGVAEKVEKASAKKYTMKPADLAKADKLNKANADFQAKCSTLPRAAATAAPAPAATASPATAAAAVKAAAPAVKAAMPAAKAAAASAGSSVASAAAE